MTILRFGLVDVFGSAPLSGNPLAVVLGADELGDDVLRRIAVEFNQPETTFVLGPRRGGTRRLRSFTAGGVEVVGVGHNALGAWWWLAQRGDVCEGPLRQELGDRILDLMIARDDGRLVVAMRQNRARIGGQLPARELASALGLDDHDLDAGPACVVSTGAAHLLVRATSRAAVDAAVPDLAALAPKLAGAGAQGCYLFASSDHRHAAARFFNPLVGLAEDPATGSAAGPLAWWLCRDATGPVVVEVEQGDAMGRPSRMRLIVDGEHVTLRGSAALAAQGDLYIDDPTEVS